jgi:hypothetical protein
MLFTVCNPSYQQYSYTNDWTKASLIFSPYAKNPGGSYFSPTNHPFLPPPPGKWVGYLEEPFPQNPTSLSNRGRIELMIRLMREAAKQMGIVPPCSLDKLGDWTDTLVSMAYEVTSETLTRWAEPGLWREGSFWWIALFSDIHGNGIDLQNDPPGLLWLTPDVFLISSSTAKMTWPETRLVDETALADKLRNVSPDVLAYMRHMPSILRRLEMAEAAEAFIETQGSYAASVGNLDVGGIQPPAGVDMNSWYHEHPHLAAVALLLKESPLRARSYDLDNATMEALLRIHAAGPSTCGSLFFRYRSILLCPRVVEYLPRLYLECQETKDRNVIDLLRGLLDEQPYKIDTYFNSLPKTKKEMGDFGLSRILVPLLGRKDISPRMKGFLLDKVARTPWVRLVTRKEQDLDDDRKWSIPIKVEFPPNRPLITAVPAGFFSLGKWLVLHKLALDCSASVSDLPAIVKRRLVGDKLTGTEKDILEYWIKQYAVEEEKPKA